MKKLVQELHRGKNINENLKLYHNLVVQTYSEYGTLELTFAAYMLVEELTDKGNVICEEERKTAEVVLEALAKLAKENSDYRDVITDMKKIRQEITGKMDLFTAYTDRLLIYEYVLNRLEYQYLPAKELSQQLASFSEETYMERLNQYLFANKDQSVVRDKLQLVIGQIPVHMTKNKLFEKIQEALTLYKGADCSSLDDFVYVLRTSAMLYEPSQYVGKYGEIEEKLTRLTEADYANLSEQDYVSLRETLTQVSAKMLEMTDFYYNLQKVVNAIYAMCLLLPYSSTEITLVQTGKKIWEGLARKEYQDEMLIPLEGKIEQSVEKKGYLESVLDEIKQTYREPIHDLALTHFFDDFFIVANLLSDSLFIDLDKLEKEEVADTFYVRQVTERLLAELSEKMSGMSRSVKRAVMGQILGKLPLAFQNTEEVQQYIHLNLFGCQNKAEKVAVLSLLWELFEEEQEWIGEKQV